jgi:hypothetical protein
MAARAKARARGKQKNLPQIFPRFIRGKRLNALKNDKPLFGGSGHKLLIQLTNTGRRERI